MKNNVELLNSKDFEVLNELLKIKDEQSFEFINKGYSFCNRPAFINSIYYINNYEKEVQEKLKTFCSYIKSYKDHWTKWFCHLHDILDFVERLRKINLAYEIVKSDKSDYIKAYELSILYKNPEEFKKMYYYFIKSLEKPNLNIAKEALENYDLIYSKFEEYEKKGILENLEYVVKFRNYFENYEYAKFAIEEYINDEESYKFAKYLLKLGIDKETFMYCVNAIKELNPDLYSKLLQKKKENQRISHLKNIRTFEKLAKGIETGYINDDTEFNIFEFFKRVPFKGSVDFYKQVTKFVLEKCPEYYSTILKYMNENKLYIKSSLESINIKKIYNTSLIINGVEITPEIKTDILKFLKYNKVPLINKTYNAAIKKYLNGEITKEMIEEKRKEMECLIEKNKNSAIKSPLIKKR